VDEPLSSPAHLAALPFARVPGIRRNERLTAATAVALLVLLAIEGVTILFLGPLLSLHELVGVILIPPVVLKLGATGYRFLRYYQGHAEYVEKGPPHPLMRFLVAPVLVASTFGVLGTGVAILALHQRHGIVVGLHKASFVFWLAAAAIHVLVYAPRIPLLLRGTR
jgi:hypothetical protein